MSYACGHAGYQLTAILPTLKNNIKSKPAYLLFIFD